MNVTVKMPDDLCRQARHRAVDESKSLSAWLADLIRRELSKDASGNLESRTLIDAFSEEHPDWYYTRAFDPKDASREKIRDFEFDPDS